MDQDVTWCGGIGLGPGDIVLDGDPASPRTGELQSPILDPSLFRPMSIVAKRSPIIATAELLLELARPPEERITKKMQCTGNDLSHLVIYISTAHTII